MRQAALTRKVQELRGKLRLEKQKSCQLELQVGTQQRRILNASSNVKAATNRELKKFEEQLANERAQVEGKDKEIDALQNKLTVAKQLEESHKMTLQELENVREQLQQELAARTALGNHLEIERNAWKEAAERAFNRHNKAVRKIEAENHALEQQLLTDREHFEQKLASKDKELEKLSTKLTQATSAHDREQEYFHKELESKKNEILALKIEPEQAMSLQAQTSSSADQLQEPINLEEQVESKEREISELKTKLAQVSSALEQASMSDSKEENMLKTIEELTQERDCYCQALLNINLRCKKLSEELKQNGRKETPGTDILENGEPPQDRETSLEEQKLENKALKEDLEQETTRSSQLEKQVQGLRKMVEALNGKLSELNQK